MKERKNKYDFIQEILESKKLTVAQRERVLLLAKKEVKKDGTFGKELEERVKRLEEEITGSNEGKIKEQTSKNEDIESETTVTNNYEDLPKYLYPLSLYKFLLKYNTNEVLKSTCHEIDSNELEIINRYCDTEQYNFEKHVEKIIEAFKILEEEFAPPAMKALIRGYLTGQGYKGKPISGWSSPNIKFNWQSQKLKLWSAENPGIPPNLDEGLMEELERTGFEFEQPIKIRNGTLNTFSELVIHFKHLFHIRGDNSLRSLIEAENNTRYIDKVEFQITDNDFPNNIEFFTNVVKLIQVYNEIIKLIIQQGKPSKPSVKLSLTEKESTIEFSILHCYSKYGKSIYNAENRLGSTYRNLIKNQINGLCNFYVQADFEKGESYKIGIWDKPGLWTKDKPIPIKIKKDVGGVEHIFEIVKP